MFQTCSKSHECRYTRVEKNKSRFESFFRKLYQVLAKDVLSEDMIGTKKKLVNPTEDCPKKFIKFWPNLVGRLIRESPDKE